MSKMNLKNFTMLFSVGAAFDKDSGNTFAINADSTIDFDNPVNILECDTEWFGNLDLNDFDLVEDWFDKEDLDIRIIAYKDGEQLGKLTFLVKIKN